MIITKVFLLLTLFAAAAVAQTSGILASANGRNFTEADLSPDARAAWQKRAESYAATRGQLLSDMVTDIVLEMEAKALSTTPAKLVEEQKRKIADPSETEINSVYEANKQALGNKPISEVRKTIVSFLRRDPEQSLLTSYIDEL